MKRWQIAALAAYGLLGLFTFGHSAAHATCASATAVDCQKSGEPYPGQVVIGALIVAPLWPLYWSWELQA